MALKLKEKVRVRRSIRTKAEQLMRFERTEERDDMMDLWRIVEEQDGKCEIVRVDESGICVRSYVERTPEVVESCSQES